MRSCPWNAFEWVLVCNVIKIESNIVLRLNNWLHDFAFTGLFNNCSSTELEIRFYLKLTKFTGYGSGEGSFSQKMLYLSHFWTMTKK